MLPWNPDGKPPEDNGDGALAFCVLALAMTCVVVLGQMFDIPLPEWMHP